MLVGLSIRDVVLIDELELSFAPGLTVLTGETGAGKSILLDSLGLALGARSDARLIRRGRDTAVVSAAFEAPADHPARRLLRDQGLDEGDVVVLRRSVGADGRSQAFINDHRAGVALLRQVGDRLVEVQGQFEQRGLLDPATHRDLLDAYAGLGARAAETGAAWQAWRDAGAALAAAEDAHDADRADEAFLRDSLEQLETLDPRAGEEARLAEERDLLMNLEGLIGALNDARAEIAGERPVEDGLRRAQARLERAAPKAGGRLDPVAAAFERAIVEVAEAARLLNEAGAALEADPNRLHEVDDRLFALRDQARKHRVAVDQLPALRDDIAAKLAALRNRGDEVERLRDAVIAARAAYEETARALSQGRREAAEGLDAAVAGELPPLKLEKARFRTAVESVDEADWAAHGIDRIAFEVATLPGAPLGPLGRIASGGELSRFMLALKMVLARDATVPTLIFDEVDSGIGGATAAAVGERLTRLSRDVQVLVVTHSPQVAARGGHHLRVEKRPAMGSGNGDMIARVEPLAGGDRREEIARMLSGHDITDEARAAADVLIAGGRP